MHADEVIWQPTAGWIKTLFGDNKGWPTTGDFIIVVIHGVVPYRITGTDADVHIIAVPTNINYGRYTICTDHKVLETKNVEWHGTVTFYARVDSDEW